MVKAAAVNPADRDRDDRRAQRVLWLIVVAVVVTIAGALATGGAKWAEEEAEREVAALRAELARLRGKPTA